MESSCIEEVNTRGVWRKDENADFVMKDVCCLAVQDCSFFRLCRVTTNAPLQQYEFSRCIASRRVSRCSSDFQHPLLQWTKRQCHCWNEIKQARSVPDSLIPR